MLRTTSTQFEAESLARPFGLRTSRSDNSFSNAINLGTVKSSSDPLKLRLSGSVGPDDKADVYKLKIEPGVAFASTKTSWKISGGKVKLSGYAQNSLFTDNQILLIGSRTLGGSDSEKSSSNLVNNSQDPTTFYFKFTPTSSKSVDYDVRLNATP